ncbi:primosomal protein DnaI [Lactobacillus sp. PV037]|uniref:primosomal protein DnaI n=1 Tax=unclassified Lactobacillus TaxID=2620435 RepID=UPI00223FB8FE|nr:MULTISPECIES: primosomal protein DnaI [unclassified Lactobacillus]QNQ81979.1 primosomal protein DnaI [Lactobacillus sp. PV012]QNQ83985.1 primosomal protein DnaI [Lactobacillus sp. PV037]
MEDISSLIKKAMFNLKPEAKFRPDYQTALENEEVKKFLATHQAEITPEIIDNSLDNLYLFTQQLKSNRIQKILQGYEPHLVLNDNLIEITYAPGKVMQTELALNKAQKRIQLIDLPEKLKNVTLSELDKAPGREEALVKIATFLKQYQTNSHARGLYLEGSFGVGKTYLLAGLANVLAQNGTQVIFLHTPSFIASLPTFVKKNTLAAEVDKITQAPVVIFDDIGAESLSEWSRDDILGVIFQKRMDNELPTFFTSNLDLAGLEKHFSETKNSVDELKAKRIMQRIRFLSEEVLVKGENRRV